MKKTLLPLAGLLALFALDSCCDKTADDPKIAVVKHAIETARAQMIFTAAKFDATTLLPRSFKNGEYVMIDSLDWTSGFVPGSMWETYKLTGDEALLAAAESYTSRLEGIQYFKETHDLGFMVFCSFGQQQAAMHDQHSAEVIVEASKTLIGRCDPVIGLIRSWDHGVWNYPVIIDNMMNLEMLFWASDYTGDPVYREVAIRHADLTIQHHFRPNDSSYHVVSYNDDGTVESRTTWQGCGDESAWARGQAWGLYGYTMCYRETGDEKYLAQAEKIAAFIMNHPSTPEDMVPYWDFDAPNAPDEPRDASAAAIIASGLLELSTLAGAEQGKVYFDYAEKLLMNLSSDAYLAEAGTNGGFILRHCVGALPFNSEIDTPLSYADYYYLEALERYLGIRGIDPLTL